MSSISQITLDPSVRAQLDAAAEQEMAVALFDLTEENSFQLTGSEAVAGPYRMGLSRVEKRLVLDFETGTGAAQITLSLSAFRQIVKDYWTICDSYYDAVRSSKPAEIETLDTARRAIHDEGARLLIERLEGRAVLDEQTARRLFTLICVMERDA